jgi:hypothetical protein
VRDPHWTGQVTPVVGNIASRGRVPAATRGQAFSVDAPRPSHLTVSVSCPSKPPWLERDCVAPVRRH